jgi:hypothetical protein
MRTRSLRAAFAAVAATVLLVPAAASAQGPCEEVIHHGAEPAAAAVDGAAGTNLAGTVHALESRCP